MKKAQETGSSGTLTSKFLQRKPLRITYGNWSTFNSKSVKYISMTKEAKSLETALAADYKISEYIAVKELQQWIRAKKKDIVWLSLLGFQTTRGLSLVKWGDNPRCAWWGNAHIQKDTYRSASFWADSRRLDNYNYPSLEYRWKECFLCDGCQ